MNTKHKGPNWGGRTRSTSWGLRLLSKVGRKPRLTWLEESYCQARRRGSTLNIDYYNVVL